MGREKGWTGYKSPTGSIECRVEGDNGILNITAFNQYTETIAIQFVSAINFVDMNEINLDNVMDEINKTFAKTAKELVSSSISYLNQNVAPDKLRKDLILVPGDLDETSGGSYQYNKLKKGSGVIYKWEVYIHTKNVLQPKSLQIKFFNDPSQESEDVKSIRDFCYAILNSPILINNPKITSKKFIRGKL